MPVEGGGGGGGGDITDGSKQFAQMFCCVYTLAAGMCTCMYMCMTQHGYPVLVVIIYTTVCMVVQALFNVMETTKFGLLCQYKIYPC